jgi:hypothetical protein
MEVMMATVAVDCGTPSCPGPLVQITKAIRAMKPVDFEQPIDAVHHLGHYWTLLNETPPGRNWMPTRALSVGWTFLSRPPESEGARICGVNSERGRELRIMKAGVLICLCLGAFAFCPGSLIAAELSFGAELDGNSRYVWRGLALSDGSVLQPSVWASLAGFTLTPWANFAFREGDATAGFNEMDFTLDYSRDVSNLTVNPSFSVYLYPNQADAPPTGELALAFSCPVGPISVFTDHSVDLIAATGAYSGDAGLGYEMDLIPSLTVEASMSAGWGSARFNEANAGVNRAALNVAGTDLALTWSAGRLFYLRPHAALSVLLDRELRAAVLRPLLITGGLVIGRDL